MLGAISAFASGRGLGKSDEETMFAQFQCSAPDNVRILQSKMSCSSSIAKNLAAPDPVRRAREAQRSYSRVAHDYKTRAARQVFLRRLQKHRKRFVFCAFATVRSPQKRFIKAN
jgi:hypothetical protein